MEPRVLTGDPSHDVFRWDKQFLDVIFRPRNIAVIGATERSGSVGRTVIENLVRGGFTGSIYGVNPKHSEALNIPCYPSVADLPESVIQQVAVQGVAESKQRGQWLYHMQNKNFRVKMLR